ncbi:unnamed protein product [Rotaria magnacalcarata]|uniref:Uncharacterized protein n=1 Tax=Rotaria magnacalcarata TaxID=392030 RepID=A0A8S3CK86_9BILA|nr:unnamed protein product [Rotaria magnacalcarata]
MSLPFHLIFVQLEDKFYLTVPQHIYTPSVTIQTKIARSQYCPHIRESFNQTLIANPILRRIKYYHLASITDWFHACAALERLVTVIADVKFNLAKSKTMAKLLIIVISLFTCVSFLHDSIHRYLIDDNEEQRTWHMVHFTPSLNLCQP